MFAEGSTSGLHNPTVHVGTPSPNTQDEWVKTNVYFHGFADIPTATEKVRSPNFFCLGLKWCLELYPRGSKNNKGFAEGMISLFLRLCSNIGVETEFGFAFNDNIRGPRTKATYAFTHNSSRGWTQFLKRETALTYLKNGALVIEVRMKPINHATPFVPENPSNPFTIKDFFLDNKSPDIEFLVCGGQAIVEGQNQKTVTKFVAHSLILRKAAPQLAEFCDSKSSRSVINIHNTSPDCFKAVLLYIYGCNIPDFGKDMSHTKGIIEVADKYGVIGLKLEAEALYVSSLTLSLENVMEHFMFAEAKNCEYLKEKTLDFIATKSRNLRRKLLSAAIEGPSSSDILAALARSETTNKDENDLSTMSISELRRKAYTKGIDVDGSREAIISALENATK